ncbi:RICIN domain-containing protein [Streptomyces sp. AC550_RSS872]|uniref:RICIN domain-containing protein n=1 Tax=Streptomyces sp. AC550_RSS872 TaxID=2823689 RepID=UPI0020B8DA99|nr:RICIN domain-containing protein [Streptomyces sp. AC550_RSS872]
MDVNGASTADGGAVIQWPWSEPAEPGRFRPGRRTQPVNRRRRRQPVVGLVPSTNGYYQFVNVHNGWCADVKDASPADGAKVTH